MLFVGAGISRLVGCPDWSGFAGRVLDQLVAKECIDHFELSQIRDVGDPKKQLSLAKIVAQERKVTIDFKDALTRRGGANCSIYDSLNRFDCPFVTTNYDKLLVPEKRQSEPESNWRVFKRDQLVGAKADVAGNVIHLHGCVDDPSEMIVTTREYLEHYSLPQVQLFLRSLFERKTVLFLGYGLEELEVLEYALRRGGADGSQSKSSIRRFVLQGFFNADAGLADMLDKYYKEAFETQLIRFPKDKEGYARQAVIIRDWLAQLEFGGNLLTANALELEREING